MDHLPHPSSVQLAERLSVHVVVATVSAVQRVSPSLVSVTLAHPDAAVLAGVPGNDVMVRIVEGDQASRRRYSVRSLSPLGDELTLWVHTAHEGPGSRWAQRATVGDFVDLVGPRGKIPLAPLADWHLMLGDASSLATFYRLAESIEAPGRVIFIVETDDPSDALTTTLPEGIGVTGIFVNRDGRVGNSPTGLLNGLAALALPLDEGHAYLFAEFSVNRSLATALKDRGLDPTAISIKNFWRHGEPNRENGEPDKRS